MHCPRNSPYLSYIGIHTRANRHTKCRQLHMMASPQIFIPQQALMNHDWPKSPVSSPFSSPLPLIIHLFLWTKGSLNGANLQRKKKKKKRKQWKSFFALIAQSRFNSRVIVCCVMRRSAFTFRANSVALWTSLRRWKLIERRQRDRKVEWAGSVINREQRSCLHSHSTALNEAWRGMKWSNEIKPVTGGVLNVSLDCRRCLPVQWLVMDWQCLWDDNVFLRSCDLPRKDLHHAGWKYVKD